MVSFEDSLGQSPGLCRLYDPSNYRTRNFKHRIPGSDNCGTEYSFAIPDGYSYSLESRLKSCLKYAIFRVTEVAGASSVFFNYNHIEKFTKIYLIVLLSLFWLLLMTVWAAEEPQPSPSEQYIVAINSPVIAETASSEDFDPNSCISYAKSKLGRFNEVWGYPNIMIPNAPIPWPGYLVLTNEGEYGHVAVITKIKDSMLYLTEANYLPGQVSTRSLDINDPRIRGFFH